MGSTPTDFSQPIYMDEPAAEASFGTQQSSTPSLDSVAVVDLNDPNLLSAEFDTNAEVDAYAAPPPVPDQKWRVKLKQIDVKGPNGEPVKYNVKAGKDGKPPYAYTAIEARIIDQSGKFDNVPLYDRFVSTMQARNGGVPIVRILTCLGVKLPAKTNAKMLLDLLFKALASEPELAVDTVWEGGLDEADREQFQQSNVKQPRVLGMHRFPQDAKGNAIPEITVSTQLGDKTLRAQVRINGYHDLASLKG